MATMGQQSPNQTYNPNINNHLINPSISTAHNPNQSTNMQPNLHHSLTNLCLNQSKIAHYQIQSPSSVTMTTGGAAGFSLQQSAPLSSTQQGAGAVMLSTRDSGAFTTTKGLLNEPGQNNCFLNSAVQVLWHLDIFRRSFREITGHACMADSCIFCALKELFSQLQFSHDPALPPDALRRALASSFFDQQRFQLGHMDDAAECFENMLLRIHAHIATSPSKPGSVGGVDTIDGGVDPGGECQTQHCIPHQKFAMTLVEQSVCGGACGAIAEPMSYTQMVHYVSASALTTQVRQTLASGQSTDSFGLLLKKAGSMGDVRECPRACGSTVRTQRTLTNRPDIVSIGIVWDSERPSLDHIMDVFATLGTTLHLTDVFNDNDSTDRTRPTTDITAHNLVGVVTYYGKHYSTFFFHTKLRVWIYFDDATVREVGPRWDQVVDKCRRGRYQPLLLLYAVPNGVPINTERAPKHITPLYTDKLLLKKSPGSQQSHQSILRRSVTPSPEKPNIGNLLHPARRAITPNPELVPQATLCQKPPLPPVVSYNDYQNLTIIQDNINYQQRNCDVVDSKEPQYVTRHQMQFAKPQVNVHRTLSNSSSSGTDGISIPDHLNVPRRRDSGNWSGDRNSASSASSTTMENPYLYLVGKVPPGSPTRIATKNDSNATTNGFNDAGYDSYSLSSNDSSTMSTIQHLMKMGHLAKIPEDYNNPQQLQLQPNMAITCDMLCDEADELLSKSRQLEDEHDLVLALALCNAAATKARAAMNAPYNNPQTLVLARMKHNTCIMRARSLHRRMTQTQSPVSEAPIEIRHTREGSSGSGGRHSRQGSRDKTGQHSRQNSKELVDAKVLAQPPAAVSKNIEIYATLPKKNKSNKIASIELPIDQDYITYSTPPVAATKTLERESRSIFSRSKNKDSQNKVKEKRSRSEDRNKLSRDFSIAPDFANIKDTIKKHKEEKEEKKDKEKSGGKKQHKIRRKLLMGGLIRRKNRSMPDLTEGSDSKNVKDSKQLPIIKQSSVDDSNIGIKGSENNLNKSMCGYLSEGHLEFSGANTITSNPSLERSKLMRKSFHGSVGKVLIAVKVPPPPPLRTTSQLSKAKLMIDDASSSNSGKTFYNQSNIESYENYMNTYEFTQNNTFDNSYNSSPRSVQENFIVITQADVHQEQSPLRNDLTNHSDNGVDEVDCCLPPSSLELPPYPVISPAISAQHSRQASEEFPPPPPPLDLSVLDEHLENPQEPSPQPGSLLAQLQQKREQILSSAKDLGEPISPSKATAGGDTWLKELQAKQAALKSKKDLAGDVSMLVQKLSTEPIKSEAKITSVKDLASRFEVDEKSVPVQQTSQYQQFSKGDNTIQTGVLSLKKRSDPELLLEPQSLISEQQLIQDEIKEVEMINAVMQKTLNSGSGINNSNDISNKRQQQHKLGKKKSVSFCDQVILVATAEEQADDSYIPNPILERVLRSAVHKNEANAIRQEISYLREEKDINPECPKSPLIGQTKTNSTNQNVNRQPNPRSYQSSNDVDVVDELPPPVSPLENSNLPQTSANMPHQPYVRQNSVDSLLLSRSNSNLSQNSQVYGTSPQYRTNYQPLPPNAQVTRIYPPQIQNTTEYVYSTSVRTNTNGYPLAVRQSPLPIPPAQQYAVYQQPPITNGYGPYNGNGNIRPINTQQCDQQQYSTAAHQRGPNANLNGYGMQTQPRTTIEQGEQHIQMFNQQNVSYGQPQQTAIYNQTYIVPQYQRVPQNGYSYQELQENGTVYQRIVEPQQEYNSPYQRVPPNHQIMANTDLNTSPYQRLPHQNPYTTNGYHSQGQDNNLVMSQQPLPRTGSNGSSGLELVPQAQPNRQSPYLPALVPKQILKKSVSFEPGTKGGADSPVPKVVVTPIVINANNNISNKVKCNLCRKKPANLNQGQNLYCTDCEFYMSRFKPK